LFKSAEWGRRGEVRKIFDYLATRRQKRVTFINIHLQENLVEESPRLAYKVAFTRRLPVKGQKGDAAKGSKKGISFPENSICYIKLARTTGATGGGRRKSKGFGERR